MSVGDQEIQLKVENVGKAFGSFQALSNCSLTIHKGEHVALLGPSGCGKTTLLNIIAGFETCDSGDLWLGQESLKNIPPNNRNIGMVFQSYALFPHMTIANNISYGLRIRKTASHVIEQRVSEVMGLLELTGLEGRYPSELSGGQQQRVAVARALAVRPVMLLLDEALSALDKNLREQMQVDLSILLRRLEITTILVTHDQREAFTIADRIAVMNKGQILQIGTPEEIYANPSSEFVLEFVGSANVLKGVAAESGGQLYARVDAGLTVPIEGAPALAANDRLQLYVRAEDIELSAEPTAIHTEKPGRISLARFLGAVKRNVIDLNGEQIVLDVNSSGAAARFNVGDEVYINFTSSRCYGAPDSQAGA